MYPTPAANFDFHTNDNRRNAVAIDCEMGMTYDGDSELIRLSMIDLFSGEALIDKLVFPHEEIKDYLTRYSGVTHGDMQEAIRQNKYISGHDVAREEIFKYVGPDTIVVVHGGTNDLMSLRWIHTKIIDTLIVESSRRCSVILKNLKNLTYQHLSKHIQKIGKGHDSLEDALATRELAIWYSKLMPIEHALNHVLDMRDVECFYGKEWISSLDYTSTITSMTMMDQEKLATPELSRFKCDNTNMKHLFKHVKGPDSKEEESQFEPQIALQSFGETQPSVPSSTSFASNQKTAQQFFDENTKPVASDQQTNPLQLEPDDTITSVLRDGNESHNRARHQTHVLGNPSQSVIKSASHSVQSVGSSSDMDDLQEYIDGVIQNTPTRRYRRAASIERDILQASQLSLSSKNKNKKKKGGQYE